MDMEVALILLALASMRAGRGLGTSNSFATPQWSTDAHNADVDR